MRLIGVVFIVFSAGSVGVRIGFSLRQRCVFLQQLIKAFKLLENEIAFGSTPLPKAFALIGHASDGVVRRIFVGVSERMEKSRWMSPRKAMELTLETVDDKSTDQILLDLSEKIGRYDLNAQIDGLKCAQVQTQSLLEELERERSVKSRTYKTLSLCAGLAVAILLI